MALGILLLLMAVSCLLTAVGDARTVIYRVTRLLGGHQVRPDTLDTVIRLVLGMAVGLAGLFAGIRFLKTHGGFKRCDEHMESGLTAGSKALVSALNWTFVFLIALILRLIYAFASFIARWMHETGGRMPDFTL